MTAFAVSQRGRIPLEATGELVAKDTPDQLVVNGIGGGKNAVVSFQIRGSMTRGTEFLFEVHGDRGDLTLSATTGAAMQRQELTVRGAHGSANELAELAVPAQYRWVSGDSRYNVAQLYARLAASIRDGKPEFCRRRDAPPSARCDRTSLRNASEVGAVTMPINDDRQLP